MGLGILLGVAVAAWLRLPFLSESLWIDELHTAWTISAGWAEVAPRAAQGNNFPLYFWLQWLIAEWWGDRPEVLRMTSLVSSLALIPAVVVCLRRWWAESHLSMAEQCWLWGLITAWVAWDDNFLFFALEARPYALAQLVAAILLGHLPYLITTPTLSLRVRCIALQALLFYLHPTNALLLPATVIARLGCLSMLMRKSSRIESSQQARDTDRSTPARSEDIPSEVSSRAAYAALTACLVDTGVTLALGLPAIPLLQEIYGRRSNWATIPALAPSAATIDRWWDLVHLPVYVGIGLVAWLVSQAWEPWTRRRTHLSVAPADRIDASTATSQTGASPPSHLPAARTPDLLRAALVFVASWALVPVTLVWLTTRWDWAALLLLRYVWSSAIAPLLLGVLLLGQIRPWWLRYVALVTGLACSWYSYGPQHLGSSRTGEPWGEVLARMQQIDSAAQYPVLVRANLIEAAYLSAEWPTAATAAAAAVGSAAVGSAAAPVADRAPRAGSREAGRPSWREYNTLPFRTLVYPTHYRDRLLLPLDNGLPPTWPADLSTALEAPAIWLTARGQPQTTAQLADAIQQRLEQAGGRWSRALDEPRGKVRLVLWRREESDRSAAR